MLLLRKTLKKIFATTLTMLIILTVYTLPTTSNDVLRTNLEIKENSNYIDNIYLLDNNLLVKVNTYIEGKNIQEKIEKIITYLTIDNNKPSNNTNSSTTQTTTSSKYEKDGYTFTIPTGYTKTLENGSDYFENDHFYFGNIKTISGATYSYYKENLNTLIESFKKTIQTANSSISYLDGKELSYSGKKYLVISFYGSGYYRDIVFTELNDNTLVGFNVFYDSMTYEDTGYASITTFLNSAKKSETNSFSSDITESDIKEDQSFIDMPNFE